MDDLNLNGSMTIEEFSKIPRSARDEMVKLYKLINPAPSAETQLAKELSKSL